MKKIQSFTLLESTLLIILISVIAGVGIPGCQKAIEKNAEKVAFVKLQTIVAGMKIYKAKHGSYPDFDMLDITTINNNLELNVVPDKIDYRCYQRTGEDIPKCKVTSPNSWIISWHDSGKGADTFHCSTGPCPSYPYTHDD